MLIRRKQKASTKYWRKLRKVRKRLQNIKNDAVVESLKVFKRSSIKQKLFGALVFAVMVVLIVSNLFGVPLEWTPNIQISKVEEITKVTSERAVCLNKPQFNNSMYKDGENPWFGAKNDTAISLFLACFREASLASNTTPLLAAGSLLGWRRHCKFNTFDGDIDLHVIKDGWNMELFESKYIACMISAGFGSDTEDLKLSTIGTDHYHLNVPNMSHALGVAHIDLYVLQNRGEITLFNGHFARWFWFPKSWIDPIRYGLVYGVEIGILSEADKFIEHRYGPHWKEIMEESNHGEKATTSIFSWDAEPVWDSVDWRSYKPRQVANGSWVLS